MQKYLIALVLTLAAFLRFYQLGNIPPSLYWDEVALGYNAYSIAQTARDEHGRFLPYDYFLSFGDYKPPVYIYAAVPLIKLFGLHEWTTRFPSAFFGTLTVLITYLFVANILRHYSFLNSSHKRYTPLLAAFFVAISPWHLQTSRVAFEANIGQFLTLTAGYLLFSAIHSTRHYGIQITLAGVLFVSTFYTFNSNRVFTPLLVLLFVALFWRQLFNKQHLPQTLFAAILSLVLLSPLLPHLFSKEGQLRYREVNIFSQIEPVKKANERIARANNALWAQVFNNRRVYYLQNWLDGYFAHFKGDFLFIHGDVNPRFSSGDIGQLYLASLPFILIGMYFSVVSKNKAGLLLLGWLFLAPVPAAFAREVPHALRTLQIIPMFDILTAFGITAVGVYLREYYAKHPFFQSALLTFLTLGLSGLFLFAQIFYFFYSYLVFYPRDYMAEWQYGYKQLSQKLAELYPAYDRIVVTNALGRAYINILFYQAYPPSVYQSQRRAKIDDLGFGFVEVEGFSKYEFRGIDWKREIRDSHSEEDVLVVGTPSEVKQGKFTKVVITDLKNQPVFVINKIPKGVDAWTELGIFDSPQNYDLWHQQQPL
jgi:4-amino-4-deoxy-L-arabinose transferase-like glycosyltransferase